MEGTCQEFAQVLKDHGVGLWGVADIAGLHVLGDRYPRAVSLVFPYRPLLQVYKEEDFHRLLKGVYETVYRAQDAASSWLGERGVKHLVVPHGGQDPETLLAMFPHKLAAVRSGLGWIGKNCLLVTPEFGPRQCLATILLEARWPAGEPVTTDQCGDCRVCVEACPYGYIHDVNWYAGLARVELFNAHACSRTREGFIPTLGHKHECGLCLWSCPVGRL